MNLYGRDDYDDYYGDYYGYNNGYDENNLLGGLGRKVKKLWKNDSDPHRYYEEDDYYRYDDDEPVHQKYDQYGGRHEELEWPGQSHHEELDWPSTDRHHDRRYADEERFGESRHTFDHDFLDLDHREKSGRHREKRRETELERRLREHQYAFDSEDEERRWYSKYEDDWHAPLQEHLEPALMKEEKPHDKFTLEWHTTLHDDHDYDVPYYYGQPHDIEEFHHTDDY